MQTPTAFLNGKFIPDEKACLHISDLSILRGYGVFDFFRVIDKEPVFMNDHLDRFLGSASRLRLDAGINRDELVSVIHELIDRNNMPLSGMRLMLTGGYSHDLYEIGHPNLVITQHVVKPRLAHIVENGIRVITHEYVRELPEVKSLNYMMGVLLQEKVKAAGVADVLYHMNNEISEFPRSNFFIVTADDAVVTPSRNVLFGITRKKTLELASKHFKAEERTVTINDVRAAKEAFVTSTTKQIVPIVQVDDMIIGNGRPGPITRFLDKEFQKQFPEPAAAIH